ncbi:cell wall-binding repeat-containing protein [Ornithinimicrobium sp. Y1847]|uniref:cell wall-binding repeat-containing protein n=1 Tax=Ornithinimicrobium sp. Y1847 TaxID=3405419 RepID=UPI003B676DBE
MKPSRATWFRRIIAPACTAALLLSPSVSLASPTTDDAVQTASADAETTTEPSLDTETDAGTDAEADVISETDPEIDAPRDQARRLTLGSHTGLSDSIDPAGEVDWFVFDAPQAGTYTVEFFEVSTSLEMLTSAHSGNTLIQRDSPGDGVVHRRISVPVAIPGTYHVRATARFGTQRGTYRVRVLPQYDQGLTWLSNGEADGALALAPEVRVGRQYAVNRAIEPVPAGARRTNADVDWIRFYAPRAGTYTVEAFDSATELRMSGWDRNGNALGSQYNGAGTVEQFVQLDVSIPGDYFVRTTTRFGDQTGTYKLRVLPQFDQGHSWDSTYEPNNTRSTGFSATLGRTLTAAMETRRSNSRDSADVDWFNASFTAGNQHVVQFTPNGFEAIVGVYNASGTLLTQSRCFSGNTCDYSVTPSIAGVHHVRVAPRFGSESGTYSLCIRRAGSTCTSPAAKVTRLGGSDRYATAAQVASQFPANVDVAFVAGGANFPDALAGAARAGAVNAPVLLTRAGSIPGPTAAQLNRLRPQRIVVLGGTGAVDNAVLQDLRQYARSTGADAVTRVSGADRFATSARISSLYSPGVATAYVATGRAFPDALSGAALAGRNGAPLLLVDTNRIPGSIDAELRRLRPQRIVILGGNGAVSGAVQTELATYASASTNKVTRIAGSDRYLTSASVASRFPAGVQGAYVATGSTFPDALAGAALAGTRNSPVLLTRAGELPGAITTELQRLRAGHGYVIGSPNVVSENVARQLATYIR